MVRVSQVIQHLPVLLNTLFDGNQTLFNAIHHPSKSFNIKYVLKAPNSCFIYLFSFTSQSNYKNGRKKEKERKRKKENQIKD